MRQSVIVCAVSVALGFGFSQTAIAADLPLKAPPAPVASPPYSWTGCYVGVNGGYGQQRRHSPDLDVSNGNVFPATGVLEPNGGFGGGQVGCNYQAGSFVYGIETDFQGSDVSSGFGPSIFTVPGLATVSASERLTWFGTVRGRIGWAVDRVLLYVTGGLAYGRTNFHMFAFDAINDNATYNENTTRTGWTLGAGAEWAVWGPWSVKVEYQYLNFGSIGPITAPVLYAGAPNGILITTKSFRNDYQTIRVGVNFRF